MSLIVVPLLLRNDRLHAILGLSPLRLTALGLATLIGLLVIGLRVGLTGWLVVRMEPFARLARSNALRLRQRIDVVGELLWGASGGHLRATTINGSQLTAILSGSLEVLLLHLRRLDVSFVLCLQFLRLRASGNTTVTAVVADAVVVVIHYRYVMHVDVGDMRSTIVADSGVVKEAIAAPLAAFKP